jgi:hypothetical protein
MFLLNDKFYDSFFVSEFIFKKYTPGLNENFEISILIGDPPGCTLILPRLYILPVYIYNFKVKISFIFRRKPNIKFIFSGLG